jgi:hypothetical protein
MDVYCEKCKSLLVEIAKGPALSHKDGCGSLERKAGRWKLSIAPCPICAASEPVNVLRGYCGNDNVLDVIESELEFVKKQLYDSIRYKDGFVKIPCACVSRIDRIFDKILEQVAQVRIQDLGGNK